MDKRIIIGTLLGAAALAFMPASASAQTFVCPGGPGPGEVQIGVGSGPGVGGAPICARDPNDYGGPQTAEELAASYGPGRDPMAEKLQLAIEMEKMILEGKVREMELERDPRYQRYVNGGWEFFQDAPDARPGELCTAFFTKKDSYVSVTGPGRSDSLAYLTFWGPNVPKPKDPKQVRVSLLQTGGDKAQTVNAFNFSKPGEPIGAIILAVPGASALLDNMLDTHHFALSLGGKPLTEVEWTGGLAARDKLKACIAKGGR